MALYGGLAKENHLSEFTTSLFSEAGVVSAATRQALAVANLGITSTAAELNQLDGAVIDLIPAALSTPAAAGITAGTGTVYTSAVTQMGPLALTQIFIDLTGLTSSTTDLDVIGNDIATDLPAHLGRITTAQNGVIFAGWMTCVELPATGVTDIDLYSATVATAVYDDLVTDLTETAHVTAGAAWTNLAVKPFVNVPPADNYLYLTSGAAGTNAVYTAGQFYITLLGVMTLA